MNIDNEEVRQILASLENKRAVETRDTSLKGGSKLQSLMYEGESLKRNVGGGKRKASAKSKSKGSSELLGEKYAKDLLKVKPLKGGSSFWEGFKKGFNSVIRPAAKVAKAIAPLAGPYGVAASVGLNALGYGKGGSTTGGGTTGGATTGGRKRKAKRRVRQSDKQKRRAALVKKVMKSEGLSLPQASKYVKDNNLEY